MKTQARAECIDQDRRQFLSTAAMGIAVVGVANLLTLRPVQAQLSGAIRPFRINVPEQDLTDLRQRLLATRLPDRETVSDQSQGVQLATIQQLVHYWKTDYDWRKVEARLNALPQFITEIDGLDIHFIHVRSRHHDAMPLIVTHG